MKKIINVNTGDVKAGKKIILKTIAIGSCIAIAAYDAEEKIGALAHVMLPGRSKKTLEPSMFKTTKYARDAIDEIINRMARLGSDARSIEACLVGGANVLKDKDDTICKKNINSVSKILSEKKIKIGAKALGGTVRRSLSFDTGSGKLFFAEGDGSEKLLWEPT